MKKATKKSNDRRIKKKQCVFPSENSALKIFSITDNPKSFTGKGGQIKEKTNGDAFREEKEEMVAMGGNNAEHEKIVNITKKTVKSNEKIVNKTRGRFEPIS